MAFHRERRPGALLLGLCIAALVVYGVVVRAEDALTNPVMAAEDPYAHMILVRGHLGDGEVEGPYPPGFHAVVATLWVFSGADLYDAMRFLPAVLGGLGLAGLALLLARHEGAPAALAGTAVLAAMPEPVFRTAMAAPTALDLALLPFLLLALLEAQRGSAAWLAVAGVITALLLLAHPWVLALVAMATVAGAVLAVAFPPWPPAPRPSLRGLAAKAGLATAALGVALASFWNVGTVGPGDLAARFVGVPAPMVGGFVAAGGALVVAVALLGREGLRADGRPSAAPGKLSMAMGVLLLGAVLVVIIGPAFGEVLPDFVAPRRMIGMPALMLAGAAFALLPVLRGPLVAVGAGLLLATLPFALYNPLDSPYWPHRTVAYLGLAVALLAGVLLGRLAQLAGRAASWAASRLPRASARRPAPVGIGGALPVLAAEAEAAAPPPATAPSGPRAGMVTGTGTLVLRVRRNLARPPPAAAPDPPPSPPPPPPAAMSAEPPAPAAARGSALATAPVVAVALLLSGAVLATTPPTYEWYRYYDACEFEVLRGVAERTFDDPRVLVVTGSWQAKLVVAALAEREPQVWFKEDLFTSRSEQAEFLAWRANHSAPAYLVVDRHLPVTQYTQLDFLQQPRLTRLEPSCLATDGSDRLVVYALVPG